MPDNMANSRLFLSMISLFMMIGCGRYNRVSVVIRNDTGYSFERITTRFGDSLHIIKKLDNGQRSPILKRNRTYGKAFVKGISAGGDTLLTYPLNRHGEKFYYEGKVLVRLLIQKRVDGSDTLVTKSRRRLF